jgi:Peptidyl-tRNA hydrolase PTH2
VVLEVKSEVQLRNLSGKLGEAGVAHKLWVEQPENYATCLATAPAAKAALQQYFKKLQLCKSV